MAKCPHCGFKLKPWHIKAECPACGVNIPNYNWEERLEEDAVRSEAAFAKMRKSVSDFKFGLVGSKLNTARLVFTFVPLIMLILPFIRISELSLPYFSANGSVSILSLILTFAGGLGLDIDSVLALTKLPAIGNSVTVLFAAVIMFALGFVAAVLNFFFLLFGSIKLRYTGNVVLCGLSTVLFLVSEILLIKSLGSLSSALLPGIMSISAGMALIAGAVLTAINLTFNILAVRQKH